MGKKEKVSNRVWVKSIKNSLSRLYDDSVFRFLVALVLGIAVMWVVIRGVIVSINSMVLRDNAYAAVRYCTAVDEYDADEIDTILECSPYIDKVYESAVNKTIIKPISMFKYCKDMGIYLIMNCVLFVVLYFIRFDKDSVYYKAISYLMLITEVAIGLSWLNGLTRNINITLIVGATLFLQWFFKMWIFRIKTNNLKSAETES